MAAAITDLEMKLEEENTLKVQGFVLAETRVGQSQVGFRPCSISIVPALELKYKYNSISTINRNGTPLRRLRQTPNRLVYP
jgi:nucleoside-triphosphatase THEP1